MKKIFLLSILMITLNTLTASAGNPLTRKIGQKFFDAAKELNLTSETIVVVTVHVNEEGQVQIINTSSDDAEVNAYVKNRMESIVLKDKTKAGVYKYRLVFKPEKK